MDPSREPTVIEFARFHGLCSDYSADPQVRIEGYRLSVRGFIAAFQDPSANDSSLRFQEKRGHVPIERLAITREAAHLLSEIEKSAKLTATPCFALPSLRTSIGKSAKLEEILLRTDHEVDVRNFLQRRAQPSLTDIALPLEVLDGDDESLAWPKYTYEAAKGVEKKLASERIAVTKEAFSFIASCTRLIEDAPAFETNVTRRRDPMREPLTPILLPFSRPTSPLMFPEDAGLFELTSDTSNATLAEAKALEAAIFAEDVILAPAVHLNTASTLHSDESSAEIDALLDHIDDGQTVSSSPARSKIADLKVETPLTPQTELSSAMKRLKTVKFSEIVFDLAPAVSLPEALEDSLGAHEEFGLFVEKQVAPIATVVQRKIDQEQLSEVDTTMRLDVPVVDFSPPQPPWKTYGLRSNGKHRTGETEMDAQTKFLRNVVKSDLKLMTRWYATAESELRLPWIPFPPQLAKVATDERISDDKAVASLLNETAPIVVTSSSLVWKPDGLRILDEDEDFEDELEVGDFEEGQDLDSVVRKRKLELEDEQEDMLLQPTTWTASAEKTNLTSNADHLQVQQLETQRDHLIPAQKKIREHSARAPFQSSIFSTSAALSNFMAVQGTKLPEISATQPASNVQLAASKHSTPSAALQPITASTTTANTAEENITTPTLSLPPLRTPRSLTPMIISTSLLLTHRPLYRALTALQLSLPLIERDYTSPTLPAVSEADIIISPSHGLILTTLQKLKQRALPGQENTSTTRTVSDRVHILSERYERLTILVTPTGRYDAAFSGGPSVTAVPRPLSAVASPQTNEGVIPIPLDASDALSLSSFTAAQSILPSDISVSYIPTSSLEYLARLLLLIISQYSASSPTSEIPGGESSIPRILPNETYWELFLRRAGLNPYAAQSLLSALRDPMPVTLGSSSYTPGSSDGSLGEEVILVSGLSAFICMSQEEREKKFAVMMGGTRVLRRVGAVLDGRWPSARDGFAGLRI